MSKEKLSFKSGEIVCVLGNPMIRNAVQKAEVVKPMGNKTLIKYLNTGVTSEVMTNRLKKA